jgi:FtsH-binding integral membrane protein
MAAGLALTGLVAWYTAGSEPLLKAIVLNRAVFFGLIIGELALVWVLSARIGRMTAQAATTAFLAYAALNGLTLSVIFLVYTAASIASTFFICAGTFFACSVFGWTTKRDLTSFGGFLFMGLVGIVIASLVNMFLQSSALGFAISYIGVFVFVGLTAYDTQKIKYMAETQPGDADGAIVRKAAILGALNLYLDFINLFIMLLRILGGRK